MRLPPEASLRHARSMRVSKISRALLTIFKPLEKLTAATERSVIKRLKTYGSHKGTIDKLLLHFDEQIKAIVWEVLNHTNGHEVLWKVAKECYNEFTRLSGNLDADDYIDPLEQACLKWPYDPDFESEEYYGH